MIGGGVEVFDIIGPLNIPVPDPVVTIMSSTLSSLAWRLITLPSLSLAAVTGLFKGTVFARLTSKGCRFGPPASGTLS
jgi:hypothetical protein